MDEYMKKEYWLLEQGYKYDAKADSFVFQIQIFEYRARITFNSNQMTTYNFKRIKVMHRDFIKRALNRE